MKIYHFLFFIMFYNTSDAQVSAFVGTFTGTYNNDNVVLVLQKNSATSLSGTMKDSYQTYSVNANVRENNLTGTATENSLGLTFQLNAQLVNNQLKMKMTLEVSGQTQVLDVILYKNGGSSASASTSFNVSTPSVKTAIKFPSGATHDANLVGKWKKSETYNSGYGDNFMGSSFEQSLILFADGSVADGGSQASMSGSHYSGSSQGGAQATPNLYWYNIGNQLYLYSTENGANQSVHLGKYYIENNAMLITGTNGKKLLLTR